MNEQQRKKSTTAGFVVERMTLSDIHEVLAIDAASFPKPWPAASWRHEIETNANAQCWVARAAPPPLPFWQRLLGRTAPHGAVLGIVCMWIIFEEAHIAAIAVRPDARGLHIGDALMRTCMEKARAANCTRMLLEVRVSNFVAQNLYRKFGFQVIGRRPRYYTDNHEDALVMENTHVTPILQPHS
ncbi:MAG: ribosomal protein S18-alanine N-acetyltransferase [Chloroflexi bacterium]|nr:ribosomal protein S18-alanine N-acetyltransferase [Chloroflexota bacterium]